ncbi:MAG: hypothetical protein JOZ45_05960 [Acidobacteriaceae bacterium]|nr:hypothetical protein [Acidobacteriaceae bacterium]MBV9305660.1 hypothetical protein [Acidobacteriaceae bacterium]
MATPAPKRSPYRQRRINAMLHDGTTAGLPPPPGNPPPSAQPNSRLPQSSGRKQALSSRPSSLRFLYIGIAAVLSCALAACFILFRQDHSSPPKAQAPAGSVTTSVPAQASAPVVSARTEAPKQPEPVPEPVQFNIRRSKSFEKIGPVRLRLVKTYPRRNVCDLYIAAGGPSYQKQVHLDKPIQIDFPDGNGSAELIVTSIRADQISGSVQ